MAEEIKIGEGVLNYITQLGEIKEQMTAAYTYATACKTSMESDTVYKGKAKEEIDLFFTSLTGNMERMIMLYGAAVTYITNAYVEHYYNEEQILDNIISQLGGKS